MKTIILIITLLSVNIIVSQEKCKVKKKYDEFEKTSSYTNTGNPFGRGLNFGGSFLLTKIKSEKSEQFYIILGSKTKGCISESNSYVTFLFENNETKKFNYSGNVDCGTSFISFNINREDLTYIAENKIKKIRICLDYSIDYYVKEKDNFTLQNDIKCVLQAE